MLQGEGGSRRHTATARATPRACALAVALATLALLGAPATAGARCTTPGERDAFVASADLALRCAQRRLRLGPDATCRPASPPACAGDTLADVVGLVYGTDPAAAADLPGAAAALRCQSALGRAAARFVRRRLRERFAGLRGQATSRDSFRSLRGRCGIAVRDDPGAGVLPRAGGPCDGIFGPPGAAADGGRAAACARGALERLVDDVAPTALRPNILVVLTDDQRWDTLEVMPAVTRLAERGVRFTNAFVSASLCCPSRASIYSGVYAFRHGVVGNRPPLGGATLFDDTDTLPVWLSAAGYRTALFGKYMNANDLLAPAVPAGWQEWQSFVRDGDNFFDYVLNENGRLVSYGASEAEYSTDLLRDRTLDFIRTSAADPFFIVYAPFAPHKPATPAPRHAGRFAGVPPWRPPNYCEADVSTKPLWVRYMRAIARPEGRAELDALRIAQLESLLAVDEAVAAIAAELEGLGLTDRTAVVFLSDNGHQWFEHWWGWKLPAYEESIRVPLVMRYPAGLPAPRTEAGLALNVDLAPTFAELAGADVPPDLDGRSLLSLLGGEPGWRTDFLVENLSPFIVPVLRGVRTARWKLVRNEEPAGPFLELYDLDVDPYELINLARDPSHAAVRDALLARLDELVTPP